MLGRTVRRLPLSSGLASWDTRNDDGGGTDGLLFAKYKLFSAGIDFREGHKKWRMKKPKVWYEEESLLWPEPATAPAESPPESPDPADATTPGEKPAGK